MILVEEIKEGCCFLKKSGTYAYLRISDSSAKYHGLHPRTHVYGICFNGNIISVKRGTLVKSVNISVMNQNRRMEENWNKTFCERF